MSDNWITIVPTDPKFVPNLEAQLQALEVFRAIAPSAAGLEIKLTDNIQLFDCGANLDRIFCPHCSQEIQISWWQDRMAEELGRGRFQLLGYSAPCCGIIVTMNELQYEFPQAFGRFGITATNPNIGELSKEHRSELERVLKTPLRIVYRHL